jgi:glutathione S-transferase
LGVDLGPVDLGAAEQLSVTYRAINPRMVVPTLVLDDGTVIGEAPALMRYLDEAYLNVPLLGSTPKEGPHDYEQIAALVERSRQRGVNFYDDSRPG